MKIFTYIIAGLIVATATQSCQSDPGEYSAVSASKYHYAPYSAEEAWSQAVKLFGDKVVDDDSAKLLLVVQYFDTPVTVTFQPITGRSCKYEVGARRYWVVGAKDSINTVYRELERHFNQ